MSCLIVSITSAIPVWTLNSTVETVDFPGLDKRILNTNKTFILQIYLNKTPDFSEFDNVAFMYSGAIEFVRTNILNGDKDTMNVFKEKKWFSEESQESGKVFIIDDHQLFSSTTNTKSNEVFEMANKAFVNNVNRRLKYTQN